MKMGKNEEFFPSLQFRRHLKIASHPAVDNEGEVVSWRNAAQSEKKKKKEKKKFILVWSEPKPLSQS